MCMALVLYLGNEKKQQKASNNKAHKTNDPFNILQYSDPVPGFAAVLTCGAGHFFFCLCALNCTRNWQEFPLNTKCIPKYPKSTYFSTNSMKKVNKNTLTEYECITIILKSDHFTTQRFIVQTKTVTAHFDEKQNGIIVLVTQTICHTKYSIIQ